MTPSELDAALITAHEAGDLPQLVALYSQAAEGASGEEAQAFYLTQAMVFALEAGDPKAQALNAQLVAMGRATPLGC